MFDVSVIICTHNPKFEYLRRTLNALKVQSLHYTRWELILVDNGSEIEIATSWDLSWHPNGRHVYETKIGLAHARLKGINQAKGALLVFVDDDNELEVDFLKNTVSIAVEYPFIGAFGGSQIGDFEEEPPQWMIPYLSVLAVRSVAQDVWSNLFNWETTPAGAGLVLRKEVANEYLKRATSNSLKQSLGRKGTNTLSGEDVDMAYTAIDMGLGCGRFKALNLVHIIPKQRLNEDYFIKLYEGVERSKYILNRIRNEHCQLPNKNFLKENIKRMYYFLFKPHIEFKINEVIFKAYNEARCADIKLNK